MIDPLEMGLFQRRPPKGQMSFHNDRGSRKQLPLKTLALERRFLCAVKEKPFENRWFRSYLGNP